MKSSLPTRAIILTVNDSKCSPPSSITSISNFLLPIRPQRALSMDAKNNYIGTASQAFRSRELEAFGDTTRFDEPPMARMFDSTWAETELIPLLRQAYGQRPGIGSGHDFWKDLDMAELIEPWHMVGKNAIRVSLARGNVTNEPLYSPITQSKIPFL